MTTSQYYTDIIERANHLNADIYHIDSDYTSGYVEWNKENSKYEIYVNKNEPYYRQRFTVAHELGHIELHESRIKELGKVDREGIDSLTVEEETQANKRAAEILMPEDNVISYTTKELSKAKGDMIHYAEIKIMADAFGVSTIALSYRLKNLGFSVNSINMMA